MKQEIKIGNIYVGIGNSGMTKDIQVTGLLIEYNHQHDHAILKEDNRAYSVTCNSLVLVGDSFSVWDEIKDTIKNGIAINNRKNKKPNNINI